MTTNQKHTPGPWYVEQAFGEEGMHVAAIGPLVARMIYPGNDPHRGTNGDTEKKANARLIAAAPELLEACQAIRACETRPGADGTTEVLANLDILQGLCAAIRKATGEE